MTRPLHTALLCFVVPWMTWMGASAVAQPPAPEKAESRTWKDAAGQYSVVATLVEQTPTLVKLKKADGLVVTVPVSKLSKIDQDYLANLTKDINPFAGGTTPAANLPAANPNAAMPAKPVVPDGGGPAKVLPGEGNELPLDTNSPTAPLEPDPMPPLLTIAPGTALIAQADAYDKVSPLAVIDPKTSLVALSVGRNVSGRPQETRGSLYVGTLPRGPFKPVIEGPVAIRLLDHHPGTGQTLTVEGLDQFQRGGEIVLMEGLATGKPQVRARRLMPGHDKPGFKPQATQAWLLTHDVALIQVNDALFCWNLVANQLIYRTPRNTANTLRIPVVSGGRRYLAMPANDGFHLIESVTGKDLGFVNASTKGAPGVCFHSDGMRVAVTSSNAWAVWDCAQNQMIQSGVVTPHLHNKITGWINNDWFLTDTGNVLDTASEMVIWNYYVGSAEARHLFNGALTLVTKQHPNLTIQTLPMPEARTVDALKQLDRQADLMVTRPGTEVRVVISAEDADADKLEQALSESIQRAGWKINPDAKLSVIATIGRGEPYSLKYREGPGRGGPQHTVKINPFTATLQIRDADGVLWSRETQNHIPRLLFLKAGETVQQAVKRYEKPQPSFFSSMLIPPRIPKKALANGLGRSRLDKGSWSDFPFR